MNFYSLIHSHILFLDSLGFLCKQSGHLQIKPVYLFPFQFLWLLFLFFCLLALARTFSNMLIRSDEGIHPCLFHILGSSAFTTKYKWISICRWPLLNWGIPSIFLVYENYEQLLNFVSCIFWIYWVDDLMWLYSLIGTILWN